MQSVVLHQSGLTLRIPIYSVDSIMIYIIQLQYCSVSVSSFYHITFALDYVRLPLRIRGGELQRAALLHPPSSRA